MNEAASLAVTGSPGSAKVSILAKLRLLLDPNTERKFTVSSTKVHP